MKSNRVTVLMPVYNAAKYLEDSIISVLSQTFTNFDFLIINDGSTDLSEEIILSFNDKRIIYKKNAINYGIAKTLNYGLRIANGEYIIRMDSDDICVDIRIEKQVKFMDNNPDIGLCGSFFTSFGDSVQNYILPTNHDEIKVSFLNKNVIAHPTVIIRKRLFQINNLFYNEEYIFGEDYELWSRAIRHFKVANINEFLLLYRKHNNQTSYRLKKNKHMIDIKIKLNQISHLIGILNPIEEIVFKNFLLKKDNKKYKTAIERMIVSNNQKQIYNHNLLSDFLLNEYL